MVEQMCPMVGSQRGRFTNSSTVVSSDALPRQQRTCRQLPLDGQSRLGVLKQLPELRSRVSLWSSNSIVFSGGDSFTFCLIWRLKVTVRTLVHGLFSSTRDHISGTKGSSRVDEFCRSPFPKSLTPSLLLPVLIMEEN